MALLNNELKCMIQCLQMLSISFTIIYFEASEMKEQMSITSKLFWCKFYNLLKNNYHKRAI